MRSLRIAKVAAWVHVALVALVVYYVTRVWNYTPLERMPSPDTIAFSATALPPLLALWIGTWLARNDRGSQLLAGGLVVALAVYAVAFLMVLSAGQDEPLAPLLLIIVPLWIALGLLVVLVAVWLISRSERVSKDAAP